MAFVQFSTEICISVEPGIAVPVATFGKFIVPTSEIPYDMFSTLAGHHREFADSLMHSIKHNFEPHNASNYLEVYLFLPQQPPPYFIRFNLPNTHASELGPGTANSASAY